MPDFYYEGISREGEKIKGELFADNEVDLRIKLRAQKIRPVRIKQNTYIKRDEIRTKVQSKELGFSDSEKMFFIKELLVMFKAGLSITQSLDVLTAEGTSKKIIEVSSTIKTYMESGMTFSQALSRFPKYFDNLFLNMAASGELRGNLEQVLNDYLEYYKKEKELNRIVQKTVLYPAAIAAIVFTSILIVVIGIAPVFVHIYRTYGHPLPSSLLTISAIGDLIRMNFFVFITLFFATAIGVILAIKTSLLRTGLDSLIIKLPWISNFFREVYTLRALLIIKTTLKTGLSMQRAIELASEKIENQVFEEELLKAREAASKNEPVSPFLAKSGLIRPMVIQVFSIGEIMGSLPEMLKETSEYLMEEIKKLSRIFSSIIEPLILILGGILIGGLLTSFFIPLFTILSKIN
jgi:type IV pilus assembly protein PilC